MISAVQRPVTKQANWYVIAESYLKLYTTDIFTSFSVYTLNLVNSDTGITKYLITESEIALGKISNWGIAVLTGQ